MVASAHTGTHVDALRHITCGPEWFEGGNDHKNLGDFGATRADAASMPPFLCRGLLLDIASLHTVQALPAGYTIKAADIPGHWPTKDGRSCLGTQGSSGPATCRCGTEIAAPAGTTSAQVLATTRHLPWQMLAPYAIVFISSISGRVGMAQRTAHGTSKAAADRLMRTLAVELAPRGIRVNSIAPGFIATNQRHTSSRHLPGPAAHRLDPRRALRSPQRHRCRRKLPHIPRCRVRLSHRVAR
jgi:hypothetical protein